MFSSWGHRTRIKKTNLHAYAYNCSISYTSTRNLNLSPIYSNCAYTDVMNEDKWMNRLLQCSECYTAFRELYPSNNNLKRRQE